MQVFLWKTSMASRINFLSLASGDCGVSVEGLLVSARKSHYLSSPAYLPAGKKGQKVLTEVVAETVGHLHQAVCLLPLAVAVGALDGIPLH